jgi:uncharacterized membrane protein YgdD (TMEM256/DUF423 family)
MGRATVAMRLMQVAAPVGGVLLFQGRLMLRHGLWTAARAAGN